MRKIIPWVAIVLFLAFGSFELTHISYKLIAQEEGLQPDPELGCQLDTSNPAITRGTFKIHGGSLQGVAELTNPSQWPDISHQGHKAPDNMMGFDISGPDGELMNLATGHWHWRFCYPYFTEISGPITMPFEVTGFHTDSRAYIDPPTTMITSVVFDDGRSWPATIPMMQGDPNGVVNFRGVFTFNPLVGDPKAANLHGPALNGWTLLANRIQVIDTNGDAWGFLTADPIFTKLDTLVPETTDFYPVHFTNIGVTFKNDLHQESWGSQVIEVDKSALPLFRASNSTWSIPVLRGYAYGGRGKLIEATTGTFEMRLDPDIHNRIPGRALNTFHQSADNNFGLIDFSTYEPGKHKLFFDWRMPSGPDGIPDFVAPNETISAIMLFNIKRGDSPSSSICTDPDAKNFGGELPCIPKDPPPVDSWQTITGTLQRLGDQIRILFEDGKKLILGTATP